MGRVFESGAGGILKANFIHDVAHGVVIGQRAYPKVRSNTVQDCRTYGIWVKAGGIGFLSGNSVRGVSGTTGVAVDSWSECTLTGNHAHDNAGIGVKCAECSQVSLRMNQVARN